MPELEQVFEPTLELTPCHQLTNRPKGQPVGDPVLQHGSLRAVAQEPVLVPPEFKRPIFLLVDEAGAVLSLVMDEGPGDADRTSTNAQALPIAGLDPTDAVQDADIHPGRREPLEGARIAVPGEDIGSRRCDLGTVRKRCLGHTRCLLVGRPGFCRACMDVLSTTECQAAPTCMASVTTRIV